MLEPEVGIDWIKATPPGRFPSRVGNADLARRTQFPKVSLDPKEARPSQALQEGSSFLGTRSNAWESRQHLWLDALFRPRLHSVSRLKEPTSLQWHYTGFLGRNPFHGWLVVGNAWRRRRGHEPRVAYLACRGKTWGSVRALLGIPLGVEETPMARFRMEVARKVIQVMEIVVEATDLDDAYAVAGDEAGNHDFSGREKDAEYEVMGGYLDAGDAGDDLAEDSLVFAESDAQKDSARHWPFSRLPKETRNETHATATDLSPRR